MKRTLIVTTDFSDSAVNAVSYASRFARDYNLNILAGIFTCLWHSLFNKSYTRQIALLTGMSVMAMHDDN